MSSSEKIVRGKGAAGMVTTPIKWFAVAGIAGSLLFGAAYTRSTMQTVAPKAGEGAGVGIGGGIQFLKAIPGGIQEMQGVAPAPVAPPAVPPAAGAKG